MYLPGVKNNLIRGKFDFQGVKGKKNQQLIKKVKIKDSIGLTFLKTSYRYVYLINTLLLKIFVKLNSFSEK